MAKLLQEILADLDNVKVPKAEKFGESVRPTDTILCTMNEDHKRIWAVRTEAETEQKRLDLRMRQIAFEARDMAEPPKTLEDLEDEYTRIRNKQHLLSVLLSVSLAREFPAFAKAKGTPIIRKGGVIVTEKPHIHPLAELLGVGIREFEG